MKRTFNSRLARIALAVAGMLSVVPAQSGFLAIPIEPLGTPASSIQPNIMFILDDSSSMGREHMPEYVTDTNAPSSADLAEQTTAACFDSGDDLLDPAIGRITGAPDACRQGDPPFNSPDFNEIYYNPDVRYEPGVDASGGSMTNMDDSIAATTSWTLVPRDAYTPAAGTTNLASGFVDRVWCKSQASLVGGPDCRRNGAYQYPDDVFRHGLTAVGALKSVTGAPYYYRMQTAQYCERLGGVAGVPDLTKCKSRIDEIIPGVHREQVPEFCTDADLTNCAPFPTKADAQATHPFSGPRWCSDPLTLNNCQRKKTSVFLHAKHVGRTTNINCQATPTPSVCQALPNVGTIVVRDVAAAGGTISDIVIGGTSVIPPGGIAVLGSDTELDVARKIIDAINTFVPTPPADLNNPPYDYRASTTASATCNNAAPPPAVATCTVVVSQQTPFGPDGVTPGGAAGAGAQIAVLSNQIGKLPSIGRIRLNSNPSPNISNPVEITTVTVNGVNLLCPIPSGINSAPDANGVFVRASDGAIVAPNGTGGPTGTGVGQAAGRRASVRAALELRIDACAVNGYSATLSGQDVNIVGPTTLISPTLGELGGATPNDQPVSRSGVGNIDNFVVSPMGFVQKGISEGDVVTSVTSMSGGQDANNAASFDMRIGVGQFVRFDITPSTVFPAKGLKRTDCGATCTYAQEMTNFANWYAYHRTRMQLMKTAVGRAFVPVGNNYRIGFITINPGNPVSTPRYLRITDFAPAHKNAWYGKLYSTTSSGGTPLREALSRVGQIYAGNLGTDLTVGLAAPDDDPVLKSCQPNFALLATDGYWDGPPGRTLDGSGVIGNVDNTNDATINPHSLRVDGVFDGGNALATGTLADVALYYYTNDLRPGLADNVPQSPTGKDKNQKQHMVTFTIGLGLEGELNFRKDYENPAVTTGDFAEIKAGTKTWPVPVALTRTTLDDLWHAAVNGRGVFYSAKNPAELADGLADIRAQLGGQIGAGAAAATSNLQPVAGDNFAFTAQFTIGNWTGDLSARTIDLSTGTVSNTALWSAAALLDATPYTNRQIYTLDTSDPPYTTSNPPAPVSGQNGLKHFCPPSTPGPACTDGAGLTPAEMAFFATTQLSQVPDAAQAPSFTDVNLVSFLRGDQSFESSAATRPLATDLFRSRDSVMGDIVNAQPAYVKRSPFAYKDLGYIGFRSCTEGIGTDCLASQFPSPSKPRRGTVYAAANDGMLHAFETDRFDNPFFQSGGIGTPTLSDDTFTGDNTGNGVERWAYMPGMLLPFVHKLAEFPYNHIYLADGSPQVGDICLSAPCAGQDDWRTILVAGLNSGGKGYYALDITNPLEPKALWEFTKSATCFSVDASGVPLPTSTVYKSDCNLGLTYGNAVITKRRHDQKWVVVVASGYHRNAGDVGAGDGKGYLYVLDAVTGRILHRLNTTAGTPTSPSGLAKINAWTDDGSHDNSMRAVYGGDLEGNVWRFKLDFDPADLVAANQVPSVTKVAIAVSPALAAVPADPFATPPVAASPAVPSAPQPITVKPELGDVDGERIIVFGTGKFIEDIDKTGPFQRQTIYALRDVPTVITPTNCSDGEPRVICNVRDATAVPVRTFAAGTVTDTRTVAAVGTEPNLKIDFGWLIDLPDTGEHVNVDPILQLGTLIVGSNVPTSGADSCGAGGYSYVNFLNLTTGGVVPGSANNLASSKIASSLLVGLNVVMLPGGAVKTIGTLADDTRSTQATPVPTPPFVGKRVSWRELFVEP